MMTNRVVRRFGEENALRCVFRDDSGARLIVKDFVQGPCYDQQSSIVANIVKRTLSHGVEINSRHYHFLAWSWGYVTQDAELQAFLKTTDSIRFYASETPTAERAKSTLEASSHKISYISF
ncbi:hypothetical protein NECAME_06468 [Necator americanus]|uniref:RNA-dependent RNA polymerase n=1 Tax=Necator americanus TaxID=51031 RepID=W2TU56_NECAM|nr:hypothetical protein NECAME_06468 [Necator americanus]ETN85308.1 hypothetical protein NECAME_06468 [Necator americanus]